MKKGLFNAILILATSWFFQSKQEQTLNEKLDLEVPAKLVEEARSGGDIVRGAILFHQGSTNCAKCHRSTSEQDRLGPDLSRMGQETTVESMVESILQPSKTIKEDYQTSTVLTVQGRIYTGLVVSQDKQQIVLRSGKFGDQLVTIANQDVEEVRLSTKSSMPDGLVNELKNRQQFLDLLRYVIDIKERGPVVDTGTNSIAQRELSDELKGWVLINKLNCVACHESSFAENCLATNRAANLKWSARWLNPGYLAKFIADPQQVKPGTNMPNMLDHLSELSRKESAEAIVQFFLSMAGNQFQTLPIVDQDPDAIVRGNDLFHSVGCVACHSPRNKLAIEQPLDDSIPLGNLWGKYDTNGLTEFLENPHAARPSGRMPNMLLSNREAQELASFLVQSNKSPSDAINAWKNDSALVERGRQLFSELGCVKCHTGMSDTSSEKSKFDSRLKLNQVNTDKGCLSDDRGDWPVFQLSDDEQQQIRSALNSSALEFTNEQEIDITLASYNCFACHSRGNLGGVSQHRREYFQTTNLNLGEQGSIPPTLTGVGAKLNPKWMRDVLVNHRSIRPYMKTRMPQFGETNIGHLIELFQSTDQLSKTDFATIDDQEQMRKQGLEIVGNRGLNCVACHTYQYKLSDTMPAVDLTEMSMRLKKGWFFQYMLAPQKFSPNTVMPSYWPNGRAIRSDIEGDPKFQVEAIWQYLLDGRQASAPRGVIREPLEIVVENEARMLRRSYAEIGKRGIGVGYPGGVNLTFDAEQMRVAMIWRGKFVDPADVWYGQGHGLVRTMGPTIIFPKGPDLDDHTEPWIPDDGRPPNHQFKGCVLDDVRRPTFRYSLDGVEVEDGAFEFIDELTGSVQLQRRIKMTSAEQRDPLRFRIAADKDITAEFDQIFKIGQRLTIHVVSAHRAKIVDDGAGARLHVPMAFNAGQVHELVFEYRWE